MTVKKKNQRILGRKVLPKNKVIFREGDPAGCAYLLKSGRVAITTEKSGEHVYLTTILPNQLFGELALIDDTPRSATAVTLEASEVVIVRPEDIERQLEGLDDFMKYWIDYLTERIRDLSGRVKD